MAHLRREYTLFADTLYVYYFQGDQNSCEFQYVYMEISHMTGAIARVLAQRRMKTPPRQGGICKDVHG